MLKKDVFESLQTILKYRINVSPDYLFYYIDNWGDENFFNDIIRDECRADYYKTGASKIVLFYDDIENWVVKLPYFGEYDAGEEYKEYNSDNCLYYERADYNLYEYDLDPGNYCEIESFLAEKAEAEGLGKLFAKTYYIKDFDGVPVYVSEKIEKTVNCFHKIKYQKQDSCKRAEYLYNCYKNECEQAGLYNNKIFSFFIDQYGQKKTENLIRFISEYRIEDLTSYNMGFDRFGKIKIIDYSSFHN